MHISGPHLSCASTGEQWHRCLNTVPCLFERAQKFTPESLEFQEKILTRSGLGQNTYLPPGEMHGGNRLLSPSLA